MPDLRPPAELAHGWSGQACATLAALYRARHPDAGSFQRDKEEGRGGQSRAAKGCRCAELSSPAAPLQRTAQARSSERERPRARSTEWAPRWRTAAAESSRTPGRAPALRRKYTSSRRGHCRHRRPALILLAAEASEGMVPKGGPAGRFFDPCIADVASAPTISDAILRAEKKGSR